MPAKKCSSFHCQKTYYKNKLDVSFFKFPKNIEIRNKWIQFCRLSKKEFQSNKVYFICSDHFLPDDFELNFKKDLLGVSTNRRLKSTAIPSVQQKLKELSSRAKRSFIKQRKQMVEDLLKDEGESSSSEQDSNIYVPEDNMENKDYEIKKFKEQIENQKKNIASLQEALFNSNIDLRTSQKKFLDLEKEFCNFKSDCVKKEDMVIKMKEILKPVLSSNQIDLVLNNKKRVCWTKAEICNAFTIRYFSKRCYIFLNKTLNFRLPAISTIQRYASKINLRHGVLEDILHLMNIEGKGMTNLGRIVVLQFVLRRTYSTIGFIEETSKIV